MSQSGGRAFGVAGLGVALAVVLCMSALGAAGHSGGPAGPSTAGTATVPVVGAPASAVRPAVSNLSPGPAVPVFSGQLSLFNNTSLANNSSDLAGVTPNEIAYDPSAGLAFVVCAGSDVVSVLSNRTNAVVGSIATGEGPDAIAYDAGTGQVFVADSYADEVQVFDADNYSSVATVAFGGSPTGLSYAPDLGEVFVSLSSGNLAAIADSNDSIVERLPVGGDPMAVAFDPTTGNAYVALCTSDFVSVVSPTEGLAVASIAIPDCPAYLAYDGPQSEMFVGTYDGTTLYGISEVTNSVASEIRLDTYPAALAFDNATDALLVDSSGSYNVTVFPEGGTSGETNFSVEGTSAGLAVDPSDGELWICQPFDDRVQVVSDATDLVVASILTSSAPGPMAFDPANDLVLVGDDNVGGVFEINGSTGTLAGTLTTRGPVTALVYDSGTGDLFAGVGRYNATINVYSLPTGSPVASVPVGYCEVTSMVYDGVSGTVFEASGCNSTVEGISDSSYEVTQNLVLPAIPYGELGIDPSAGLLYAGLGDFFDTGVTAYSITSGALVFTTYLDYDGLSELYGMVLDPEDNVLDTLTWNYGDNYAATVYELNASTGVVVGGHGLGAFTIPTAFALDPDDAELFVAEEYPSQLAVVSEGAPATVANIASSEYLGTVLYDPIDRAVFVADPDNGSVSVYRFPPVYTVVFQVQNLPDGKSWTITAGGATVTTSSSLVTFSGAAGSYTYLAAGPKGWDVEVEKPSGSFELPTTDFRTTFELSKGPTYSFALVPKGLPEGATVCGGLTDAFRCTDDAPITYENLTPASYFVSLPLESGYAIWPITVKGAPYPTPNIIDLTRSTTITVHYNYYYALFLVESGLPNGTDWGGTLHFAGSELEFTMPAGPGSAVEYLLWNGTVRIHIDPVAGYSVHLSKKSPVRIDGASVEVLVTFAADRAHSGLPGVDIGQGPIGAIRSYADRSVGR